MRKFGKIKLCPFLIIAFLLILSVYSAEAKSLKKGEIYRLLDENVAIRVISNNELEFEEGNDIIVCSYSVDNKTVRVVCTILGSKTANYYDIIQEGLKERKSKTIFYSKATFKAAREKHYCSAIKANLVKLACTQESYFKRHNSYIVNGGVSELYWEGFKSSKGVVISLTGVPDRYFMAMGTHNHCPYAFISDSSKRVLQGPLSREKAGLIFEETREKAEQEKKLAREKKEREDRLAREKKEREDRLARKGIQLYQMRIEDAIKNNWSYPALINIKGKKAPEAIIIVTLRNDGKILKAWFRKKSNNPLFDDSVLKAVERSDPLPEFPPGYLKSYDEVEINFNLKDLVQQ